MQQRTLMMIGDEKDCLQFHVTEEVPNPDKPEPNIYPQIHTNKRSLMNKNEK